MTEIRWHGRGGLGAFTAARLLGCAVSLYEGKYALAFPSFGPERRGAPVFAFTRIDNKPITDRSEVVECDIAIVLDDTLFGDPVRNGLKPGATVIVNARQGGVRHRGLQRCGRRRDGSGAGDSGPPHHERAPAGRADRRNGHHERGGRGGSYRQPAGPEAA